jgi:hypothetical protein
MTRNIIKTSFLFTACVIFTAVFSFSDTLNTSDQAYLNRAKAFYFSKKNSKWKDAKKALKTLLKKTDNKKTKADIYYLLGNLHKSVRNNHKALTCYKKAVKASPDMYGNPRKSAAISYVGHSLKLYAGNAISVLTFLCMLSVIPLLAYFFITHKKSRKKTFILSVKLTGLWIFIVLLIMILTKIINVPVVPYEVIGDVPMYAFLWIGFLKNSAFLTFMLCVTPGILISVFLISSHDQKNKSWQILLGSILLIQIILFNYLVYIGTIPYIINGDYVIHKPNLHYLYAGSESFSLFHIILTTAGIIAAILFIAYTAVQYKKHNTLPLAAIGLVQSVMLIFSLQIMSLHYSAQKPSISNTYGIYYLDKDIEPYVVRYPQKFVNLQLNNFEVDEEGDQDVLDIINEKTIKVPVENYSELRRDDVKKLR